MKSLQESIVDVLNGKTVELDEASSTINAIMLPIRRLSQEDAQQFCKELAKWLAPQEKDFEMKEFGEAAKALTKLAAAISKYEP